MQFDPQKVIKIERKGQIIISNHCQFLYYCKCKLINSNWRWLKEIAKMLKSAIKRCQLGQNKMSLKELIYLKMQFYTFIQLNCSY